jgi:hypothetical protein
MNDRRIDHLARLLAGGQSRRGVLGGLLGFGSGLAAVTAADAACPSGQISRRGSCVCRATGRPPVGGLCPCPNGQVDLGDGLGCLACRSSGDCPPSDACTAYACSAGACKRTATDCPDDDPCRVVNCDPAHGCVSAPVPANEPGGCPTGSVCCADGRCTPLGTASNCAACGDAVSAETPFCSTALGLVECLTPHDCGVSDACTTVTCEAGVCGSFVTENAPCDDGDPCTVADRCRTDGFCAGTTVVCDPPDQCHEAAVCNPTTGACEYQPKANNTPCDDGNPCTHDDVCIDGVCGGTPVVCMALDQCHDPGVCDAATGLCSNPAKANGTPCADGNACTQTDTCQAGLCVGGDPVVCTALDACHDPGVCDTETGLCTNPAKPDGVGCSDGNACTQTDTCQAGVCTGANPVECAPPDQCHEFGTCNAATGECEYRPKADGSTCAGADLCLTVYTCQAGVCTGREPVVCPDPDQCHTAGACNPATGTCSNPAKSDGTACETGNLCTSDTCQAGVCTEGAVAVFCPPITDEQCQIAGVCDPATGICLNGIQPNGEPCDDGNACTRTDTCQDGVCVGGNPVSCPLPAVGSCRQNGVCSPATGICAYPDKPNGASCETGNRCTADTCQDGVCVEGAVSVSCPRTGDAQCGSPGVCDPGSGVCVDVIPRSGAPCDDGNACTRTDTCVAGFCVGGDPVHCDPPGVCQQDGVCNPATGTCSYAKKPNGSACPDGTCCNGSCCPSGQTCCNGVCCATGQACCNGQCCAGQCCGGQCCPTGRTCCFGTCCAAGAPCCNRQCCGAGDRCCSGGGSDNGCCGETCCGTICCAFPGATCCPGNVCKVGVSC